MITFYMDSFQCGYVQQVLASVSVASEQKQPILIK